MSEDKDKIEIDDQIGKSENRQIINEESEVFSRNITKMQAPDEWPEPPKESNTENDD